MSIDGVSGIGRIGAVAPVRGDESVRSAPASLDDSPSAFFDMTGWTGRADAQVTVGPASAKAPLQELSASVLSAILR